MSDLTLKEWSKIAIAKHSRKILKYEAEVLKDQDPENLHQMRVGMRRLRSAISGFAIALDLPESVSDRKIAKIGRKLGKLRDLDVLLATLSQDYRSRLPKSERKSLDKVIKSLQKKRKKALKQVRSTLNSKLYLNFTQGLQDWLEESRFLLIGDLSIYHVVPDLLLPQLSQLLLHPGWLVGVELKKGSVHLADSLDRDAVKQLLEVQEPILHDLRKTAKKTRYNLELFSGFYGETYNYYVTQIEQIQEVLGQIQDCYVLRVVLEKILRSAIAKKMPKLATHFSNTRYQKWQEWQILQEEFLDHKTRQELRQTIGQPMIS
ncbi:MAG: CHAD domain-containing protein [Cyanobacteria bacterium P01_F01_bin.143]